MTSTSRSATLPASSMSLTAGAPVSGAVTRSSSFLQFEEISEFAGSAAFGRTVVRPSKAFSNARKRSSECSDSSICLRIEINRCPTTVGFGERVRGALGGDPFPQRLEEEFHLDRLGDVVVHARRQTLLAATRQHLRGHRHNRNVLVRAFPAADFPRGCVAIHLRHLAIHEDQVVGQKAEHLHRLPAVRRQVRTHAELFEHARGHLLVHDIVLGHQHPYRQAAEANRQRAAHLFDRAIRPDVSGNRRLVLPRPRRRERIQQLRLPHWFDQRRVNRAALLLPDLDPLTDGSQQHHHRFADLRIRLDGARQLGAVHARHLVIENREMVGIPAGFCLPERLECLFARRKTAVAHSPTGDLLVQHAAIHFVIVHDESAQIAQIVHRDGRRVRVGIERQRQGERKCGAFSEAGCSPRWSLP